MKGEFQHTYSVLATRLSGYSIRLVIRKLRVESRRGCSIDVFSSDPAVTFSIFGREKEENGIGIQVLLESITC